MGLTMLPVGTKVVCVNAPQGYDLVEGENYVIEEHSSCNTYGVRSLKTGLHSHWWNPDRFELPTEKKRDLRSFSWTIPVNGKAEHDAAVQWLEAQGITAKYDSEYDGNTFLEASFQGDTFIRSNSKKLSDEVITLKFAFAVVDVEWAEDVNARRIRELEETIQKAQEQIQALKGGADAS